MEEVTVLFCVAMCKCNLIKITDETVWGETDPSDPVLGVQNTNVVITGPDGTVYEYDDASYTDPVSIVVDADGTNFPDGEYNIVVTYTLAGDSEVSAEQWIYNTCNIKCIIDKLVHDLATEDCGDCKNEKLQTALEAYTLYRALCAAIKCGNITTADSILEWLNEKLINYKCKNC